MKKKAFTLAEIIFCMILICFMYLIVLYNIKTEGINDKAIIATANKTVSSIDEASLKLRGTSNCPNGSLMDNVAGTSELGIINDDGTTPDASDIINIYSKFLKFTKKGINFCDYTTYCQNADIETIEGAKLPGDVVIGIEVLEEIETCPDYKTIDTKETIEGKDQCWGKLYIDVNSKKEPDTLDKDVFIFGLDKNGVNKWF